MARKKNSERLPPRKDGKKRTKRQKDTLRNSRNHRARKFYDEVRPKWKKKIVELHTIVRELRHGLADVTRLYQAKCEEVVALSTK